ncbi:mannose-specific lectin-like protein [Lates japonicus]|uniref:Mannose-specific lectin-like protein n=1 Tax=Lates japonicus TaxID=270547 RepID=A0AAD3RHE1_LATJO|nr:mannose-specific lectin-like protein [Lates japonicus]
MTVTAGHSLTPVEHSSLIMSRNFLSKNDELRRGDYLISNNREFKAIFQDDGNFVIYGWQPLWASDTSGSDASRLCMQADCNLVMYNNKDEPREWKTVFQEDEPTAPDPAATPTTTRVEDGRKNLNSPPRKTGEQMSSAGLTGDRFTPPTELLPPRRFSVNGKISRKAFRNLFCMQPTGRLKSGI